MFRQKQSQVSGACSLGLGNSLAAVEFDSDACRPFDDYLGEVNARFSARLHSVAEGITGDADLAKDAVQEALIALWQADNVPSSPYGWLHRTVVHRSLHAMRTEWRRRRRERHADSDHLGEPDPDPMDIMHGTETEQRLLAGINNLAPGVRDVFLLREWRGLDYQSIADVANVPIGTVRSRLKRARHTLLRAIAIDGGAGQ